MYIDARRDLHIFVSENFCNAVNIHTVAAQISPMCVPQLMSCKARHIFIHLCHPAHFRFEPAAPGVRAHQPAIRARNQIWAVWISLPQQFHSLQSAV